MKCLVLCSLFVYVAYNIYIILTFGMPKSLSQTSYTFLDHNKKYIYFSIFCFSVGDLILLPWISVSRVKSMELLASFSVGGFILCGMTPLFHRSFQKYIHYLSAFTTGVSYFIWMWLCNVYVFMVDLILVAFITLFKKNNYVYHTENVIAISLMIFLLVSIK